MLSIKRQVDVTTESVENANSQSAWTVVSQVKKSGYPIPCKRLKDTSARIVSNIHVRADARDNYQCMLLITMQREDATQFAESVNTQHARHVGKGAL